MRVMHFNSDIHTVTYLSKNAEIVPCWRLSRASPWGLALFCWGVVNSSGEHRYYVELIGIKGPKLVK